MKRWPFALLVLVMSLTVPFTWPQRAGAGNTPQAPPGPRPEVGRSLKNDVSPPLSSLPAAPQEHVPEREVPINRLPPPQGPKSALPDPVLQQGSGGGSTPPARNSWDGGKYANVAPPDTNGDVGPNHYVQWVNLVINVYDKSGTLRPGYPKLGNSLWSGFGGLCDTTNRG